MQLGLKKLAQWGAILRLPFRMTCQETHLTYAEIRTHTSPDTCARSQPHCRSENAFYLETKAAATSSGVNLETDETLFNLSLVFMTRPTNTKTYFFYFFLRTCTRRVLSDHSAENEFFLRSKTRYR